MTNPTEQAAEYARHLLGEIKAEMSRADTKASIMLGATAVAVGATLGGLFAGDWRPHYLGGGQWLWWCGTALTCAAIVMFLAAVYPRLGHGRTGELIGFYGDAARQRSPYALVAALERSSRAELEALAEQIAVLSRLVRAKYRLIQAGVWTLAAATAALVTSPFLG